MLSLDLSRLRTGLPNYDTPELAQQWQCDGLSVLKRIGELGVHRAMSVGTRRILFQACRAIGAKRILDIGTYVGTSALNFALAAGEGGRVITVDIAEANAPDGYWKQADRPHSPAQMMDKAGVDVEFVTGRGVDYLSTTTEFFDFVCVDANKREEEDYEALRLALLRLNPGGVIFFDDVFPHGKPVSAGGFSVEGTWKMLERAKQQGLVVHQMYQDLEGSSLRCAFVTR